MELGSFDGGEDGEHSGPGFVGISITFTKQGDIFFGKIQFDTMS